jgi:dienelactone hydrolase
MIPRALGVLAACGFGILAACSTQAEPGAQTAAVAATQTAAAPMSTPIPIADLRPLFDYDATAPLDLEETGVEYRGGIAVHDISYASPASTGGRATAYLIVPPGEGPFASVLFAHPGDGSRTSFLDEGVALARAGAVALLVDAPWARPDPWRREFNYTPDNDRGIYVQDIVDLRRGVDLLVSLDDVDPERIGFIGHSSGAHEGGVLSGVETRIRAYVLMAGVPSRSDRLPERITSAMPAEDVVAYLEAIRPLDAVHYVGHAAPAELLFQCGRQDEVIAEATFLRYYEVASQPKQIVWYDAGHSLGEQARLDRARWLAERIGLSEAALE